MNRVICVFSMAAWVGVFALAGCNDSEEYHASDAGADTDADADSDSDADTDTDSDTDADSDTDTDADSDTDTDTDTDSDAGADWSGDCVSNDDCPGGECVRIPDEEGGWWTCVYEAQGEATEASENPTSDECTDSSECEVDCGCYLVEEYYPGFYLPHNECLCPACESDADCEDPSNQQCIPAGALGEIVSTCVSVACHVNGDCMDGEDGMCAPYFDSCSSLDDPPVESKACHYAGDECEPGGTCSITYETCAPDTDGVGFSCQSIACPG